MLIQKATRQHTKTHNKQLILKTIYDHSPISRADVARRTGLTRPTVSSTVSELIEEGLIAEVGHGPSAGGKRPILLSLVDDAFHIIGLDLANSQFQGAVINLRGEICYRASLPAHNLTEQTALDLVYTMIDTLIATSERPLLGIGIGTPGVIDSASGIVQRAVNLGWQDLPLRDLLSTKYDLPVYIANDSHVAAQAEYTFGNHIGVNNLIVVKVGRGIGAGIILNGQLFYGDGFGAGEIGHVVVTDNGELCSCGNRGCLETISSSRALMSQAEDIAKTNPASMLSPHDITMDQIVQAHNRGDTTLQPIIENAGRYLGVMVAGLTGTLNIQQVFIAGSVSRFGEDLLVPLREQMEKRVLTTLAENTHVEIAALGSDIVLLGAAALLLTKELGVV